jgi:hypothetical protein
MISFRVALLDKEVEFFSHPSDGSDVLTMTLVGHWGPNNWHRCLLWCRRQHPSFARFPFDWLIIWHLPAFHSHLHTSTIDIIISISFDSNISRYFVWSAQGCDAISFWASASSFYCWWYTYDTKAFHIIYSISVYFLFSLLENTILYYRCNNIQIKVDFSHPSILSILLSFLVSHSGANCAPHKHFDWNKAKL